MSRHLLLAATAGDATIPDPLPVEVIPIPDDPIPYTLLGSAPYNPPVPCQINTYDGSDQTLHPTVHDFGPGQTWNGYRFWLCHTPYPFSNADFENPSIEASNNGWDWHTPEGLTNPIFPQPAGSYNSDPDFAWNPALNRMELIYRPMNGAEHIVHSHSTNGINWSAFQTIIAPTGGIVSPSLLRLSASSWRIYARRDDKGIAYWSAANVTGPWTGPTACTLDPGGIPQNGSEDLWHIDAMMHGSRTLFLFASYPSPCRIWAAYSDDGINIVTNDVPVIEPSTLGWDVGWLYRASMTLHENGTHARVWYSGQNANVVKTGLTTIPLSAWNF